MNEAEGNSDRILEIPKGVLLEIGGKSGDYYSASIDGRFGYMCKPKRSSRFTLAFN